MTIRQQGPSGLLGDCLQAENNLFTGCKHSGVRLARARPTALAGGFYSVEHMNRNLTGSKNIYKNYACS
jgi:hypothetical protein